MKKIGILSMQRIRNYGSFLQAYGLKQIIEKLGYEVEFVDYHIQKPIIESNNLKNGKLGKIKKILTEKTPFIQKIKYILFKRNFSNKYYDLLGLSKKPNYTPKIDTLVIGSDEVFNCIQENENVGYSLELFGKDNNAKKVISYAASFGNTTIEKLKKYKKEEEIKELLLKFNAISVRDKNSGDIVENLTNRKVEYNLDPVLIYDYMNECKLIPEIKNKEKYLIVYAYSGRITDDESDYIKSYAKKRNLKIYAIGGPQKCADKFIDCSPFEVLAYFKNAELVITDTFHGSIFSIINHKNFVTLVRKSVGNSYGNEEKLTDLLMRIKLTDRTVYNVQQIEEKLETGVDYFEVDKIIEKQRKKSYKYIRSNI